MRESQAKKSATKTVSGRESNSDLKNPSLDFVDRSLVDVLATGHAQRRKPSLKRVSDLLEKGNLGLTAGDIEVVKESASSDNFLHVESAYAVVGAVATFSDQNVVRRAERQLSKHLSLRTGWTGQRYVGVLTDGKSWSAYHLVSGNADPITSYEPNSRHDGRALFYWLDGVLAARAGVPASPTEIRRRLGAESASHAIDFATLASLYQASRDLPTVKVKRQLWAQLLKSALGTQFTDDDELFIEHTLLMNSADTIAHLVLGIDVLDLQPTTLLSGQRFDQAGIFGVVEQDFFNWTIEVPGGNAFVQALARRLSRFSWSDAEQDILKILYESCIGAETRKRLGEYYTPDWLAEYMVESAVTAPLHQRVLDPACGSGTFLFHSVRRYLAAADAKGLSTNVALANLSRQVIGVDLHPVAVALARVTYLLAIGRERLTATDREAINIPVYLGDSVQWRERIDLFTGEHLKIKAGHGASLLEDVLLFPQGMLDDPARFDRLVARLAGLAAKPRDRNTKISLEALFDRMAINAGDRPLLRETFDAMCRLHEEGRNHIWSYYLRNLARPLWLAMPENRVDVLVGNPPWLSYRHMPAEMQDLFRTLSDDRGLWHGGRVAPHQDLSALFTARAIQQYLRIGGTFAFVLPNAVLDRDYFRGFRTGYYRDEVEPTAASFEQSWDLRKLRPHVFLRGGCCVLLGQRSSVSGKRKSTRKDEIWSGRIPKDHGSWRLVSPSLIRQSGQRLPAKGTGSQASPYKRRFLQGATMVPRTLFFVDTEASGPLGLGRGRTPVRSAPSRHRPWSELPAITGIVESEFIRPVILGESLVHYLILEPRFAVLPVLGEEVLNGADVRLHMYEGMADWWTMVENIWDTNRTSARMTLLERLNFHRGLAVQLPTAPLRVVYSKSAMHVAAAVVTDPYVLVDHKLYWATINSMAEGDYLCAILNSPYLTDLVRPLMSYSKDERDIDKTVWNLPIPIYDDIDEDHQRLAEIGALHRRAVAELSRESENFVAFRRRVRLTLAQDSAAAEVRRLTERVVH